MENELNLREFFTNLIKFHYRNFKIIIVIILLSNLSVYLYQNFKKPYYETYAICVSGISEYERTQYEEELLQRTAIDLINQLQINVENQDHQEIANLLNIEKELAENIKKIEAEQLYQQDLNEDSYTLNKFQIFISVYDNTIIQDIQNGLLFYFENNQYIKNYYSKFISSNNHLIRDINTEIEQISLARSKGAENNFELSNMYFTDNEKVGNQIIELSQLREKLIAQKDLLKPLVFVKNFSSVEEKEDDVFIWLVLFSFLSYLFSLFISLVKEVKDY